ncbi:MAG: lytic transglycosylase domain-containing protein [Acidobacteriaceae bacterium]|nr:lytic transglycosylase domain-containing protein [Acidobacteriaceae bacterium]
MRLFARFALTAVIFIVRPSFGKEAVYLNTGFSLEVDSHTRNDEQFRFVIGTGTLEFPADQVIRIETLSDPVVPAIAKVPGAVETPEMILNEAAYAQGLDQDFVRSVAKVESGLRQNAISRKGAIGLMQLMPSTAAELGVNADQAPDNAKGGSKYLRDLLIRYHGNSALALAAYNAGPAAVARYGGVPPFAETQHYVLAVLREYRRALRAHAKIATLRAASKPSATD